MRFSKWHGLANDYLLIERADVGHPLEPALVRRLCDYHLGIGSDGVLEVLTAEGPRAEIVIWNPDGSTAELSGNGTRIAARWLARRSGESEVVVAVGPREVVARMRDGLEVETEMGLVEVGPPELLAVNGSEVEFTPVSVGNPHAVIRRDPDRAELLRLGPLVESHPRFPERTNVEVVSRAPGGGLVARVWERGVGETAACGTGACAAACVAAARLGLAPPIDVRMPGGLLRVAWADLMSVTLAGAVQREGTIEP